ncbi:hypothetical protein K9M79_00030 [Candidatus Woesearchaeota archaeon]|nr:hypothetical protein [Candidatus Woesearchaeota archaeon]
MINHSSYEKNSLLRVFLLIFLSIVLSAVVYSMALENPINHLICNITNTETCTDLYEISLIEMTSYTDAHTILSSHTPIYSVLYPYKLCCGNVVGLEIVDASDPHATPLFHLDANSENSHIELYDQVNFPTDVNIKWTRTLSDKAGIPVTSYDESFSCHYQSAPCSTAYLTGEETEVIGLQQNFNSHASIPGEINFPIYLCCENCVYENSYPVTEAEVGFVPSLPSYCFNGVDDDCDGFTDENDSDCQRTLSGTVYSSTSPLNNVSVEIWRDTEAYYNNTETRIEVTTNSDGEFLINNASFDDIGYYNIIFRRAGYESKVVPDINLSVNRVINMEMEPTGTVCFADCTSSNSDGFCVAACEGANGCDFYDDTVRDVCADPVTPRKKGYIVPYNSTHNVECCGSISDVSFHEEEDTTYKLNVNSEDVYTSNVNKFHDGLGKYVTMKTTLWVPKKDD